MGNENMDKQLCVSFEQEWTMNYPKNEMKGDCIVDV